MARRLRHLAAVAVGVALAPDLLERVREVPPDAVRECLACGLLVRVVAPGSEVSVGAPGDRVACTVRGGEAGAAVRSPAASPARAASGEWLFAVGPCLAEAHEWVQLRLTRNGAEFALHAAGAEWVRVAALLEGRGWARSVVLAPSAPPLLPPRALPSPPAAPPRAPRPASAPPWVVPRELVPCGVCGNRSHVCAARILPQLPSVWQELKPTPTTPALFAAVCTDACLRDAACRVVAVMTTGEETVCDMRCVGWVHCGGLTARATHEDLGHTVASLGTWTRARAREGAD